VENFELEFNKALDIMAWDVACLCTWYRKRGKVRVDIWRVCFGRVCFEREACVRERARVCVCVVGV